jgi:hypothetical protein
MRFLTLCTLRLYTLLVCVLITHATVLDNTAGAESSDE